jgi:hypothetical protein
VILASAVVIAQAIQLGPEEAALPPPSQPVDERRFEPPPPTPLQRVAPFVHLMGGAALGSLPGVAPELALGGGVERGRLQGELRLSHALRQSLPIAGTNAEATIDRWALALSGCFAVITTRANTSAVCLGAGVERIFGRGDGLSRPESQALWLLSPVASLKSSIQLGHRWALVLNVGGTVRPYHPRFVVDDSRPVYAIPVVGGSLLGGLQLAL